MTTEAERELIHAALAVAIAPPLHHGDTTFAAKVPWNRIETLRNALLAAGIDWGKAKGR
jgi:hypothetical protein